MDAETKSSRPQNRQSSSEREATSESAAAQKSKRKFGAALRTSLREVGQRVGGRGKTTDVDSASTTTKTKDKDKEKKKKMKKMEKLKSPNNSKASKTDVSRESSSVSDVSEVTPLPAKTRQSKASTLVRKLSFGKRKISDTNPPTTPTPDASPKESPSASKSDASSESISRQAPDGEDGTVSGTPPTPPIHQPEPLLPAPADQSQEPTAITAAEEPVTSSSDADEPSTPQPTPEPTVTEEPQLVETIIWNLQKPTSAYTVPLLGSKPVPKGAAAEAEPRAADDLDLRAPPLVASVAATVRDVAASSAHEVASEGAQQQPVERSEQDVEAQPREEERQEPQAEILEATQQLAESDAQISQETEEEREEPSTSEQLATEDTDAPQGAAISDVEDKRQESAEERIDQQEETSQPQPEPQPLLEAAAEKPQPVAEDVPVVSAEGTQEVPTSTPEAVTSKSAASDTEPEELAADMSQRRNRKRQMATGVAADVGMSPGAAGGLIDSALPSLKAELATADRQRESEASEEFLDAERSEGALPNGTGEEEEFAPAEDGTSQPVGAVSIGEAIAEARSKLTESLGAAAVAAQQPPANPAQQLPEKREHLYKILVIGELGTGKTSIIKRYVHQFFSQHYRATIGVDFALKVLNWDANTIIRLQMWDIAGQERFGNMTRVYYKEAVGAFIVFDVTRVATFEAVLKWKQDLDSKVTLPDGSPIPCVLLANKCDQQKEGLVNNATKMDEYCKEKGFSAWYETSAKENINIDEAARTLVKKILQNDQMLNQNDAAKDAEKINLDGKASDSKSGGRCSC